MTLDIPKSFNKRLITPYVFKDRMYYVQFFENKIPGPFYVCDAPYSLNAMVSLGELKTEEEVVGHIFYSQANIRCGGSFLLAYSGVFKSSLDSHLPKDFDMDLVLKTEYIQVFHKKNRATLVISPNLKDTIRKNLEV
jgi:hypothetical protein